MYPVCCCDYGVCTDVSDCTVGTNCYVRRASILGHASGRVVRICPIVVRIYPIVVRGICPRVVRGIYPTSYLLGLPSIHRCWVVRYCSQGITLRVLYWYGRYRVFGKRYVPDFTCKSHELLGGLFACFFRVLHSMLLQ